MQLVSEMFFWILLWVLGWGIWSFLYRKHINYLTTYKTAIVYFASFSFFVFFIYRSYLLNYFLTYKNNFPYILVLTFFIILIGIYFFMNYFFDKQILQQQKQQSVFFASMDFRYLLAKSFDIFFQQLLVLSLTLLLRYVFSNSTAVFLTAVLFGLLHLPLLQVKRLKIAPIIVLCSFLGGYLFSYLIIYYQFGFVYSYLIHWSFYVIIGVGMNIYTKNKLLYKK